MERHFHEQLQDVKDMLVSMASVVESSIEKSIESLIKRDDGLAQQVIEMDEEINDLEIRIDEQCLTLLALQQPVAVDLRFLTSAMKINNDLERMGDHSVNIAQRAQRLNRVEPLRLSKSVLDVSETVKAMVRAGIRAFVEGDVQMAQRVCVRDDEVDEFDDLFFHDLLDGMFKNKKAISRSIDLMLVSKNLERIADLSTNIAEEVIFIYEAQTIKHHSQNRSHQDVRSRS